MEAKEYVILTNSASKRALFPSISQPSERSDDEDSLGHMSPLKSSSPDRYSSPRQSPCWSESPIKSPEASAHGNDANKRLELAQAHRNLQTALSAITPQKMFTDIIGDTPEKESRSDMLTPFKCLIQPRNIQETPDSTVSNSSEAIRKLCWKKKEQIRSSPEKSEDSGKSFDFNSSAVQLLRNSFYGRGPSKAKTSLFPETVKIRRPMVTVISNRQPKRFSNTSHSRGHSKNTHKRPRIIPGEINAGVWHRVKRPKPKVKRVLEVVKRPMEKPLISPEDRLQKCLIEQDFIDAEGNTPKRRRLHVLHVSNSPNGGKSEVNPHSSETRSPNVAKHQEDRKSPEIEVVPDPSRKFFKTNRTMAIDHKATVTVVNNVKIQVHKGKMALDSSPTRKMKPVKKRPVVMEYLFEEDQANALDTNIVQETVQEVLQKLDNEIEMSLPAEDCHNIQSITSSTSSLALHDVKVPENVNDLENHNLEPRVSEVVEAHGTIASNENQNCENIAPGGGTSDESHVLYPVFYKRKGLHDSTNNPVKRASPHIKKMRLIGENQYQIDAGQSRFRAVHCKDCGTLYHVGDPEDEIAHYHIHNNISTFRFGGWKNEHVVKLYSNGERVIVVYPNDPKVWVNKANDVLGVIDKEMGIVDSIAMQIGNNKVYLYVLKNRIVGVLAAEPRSVAYRMISTGIEGPDCCTEETYPVLCGISRIWTAPDQRRKGIATKLVDSLRLTFMFDHILDKKEIALSVPSELGKAFAASYMDTPEFMVYYK